MMSPFPIRALILVLGIFGFLAESSAQSVSFRETQGGESSDLAWVESQGNVPAVPGDFYVVALSTRFFEPASMVTGLGVPWIRMVSQCAARGQAGLEVWVTRVPLEAEGTVGRVRAEFFQPPQHALMSVSRYSGVAAALPASIAANTLGVDGPCEGGIDSSIYDLPFGASIRGSRVISAVTHRHRAHTPGDGYQDRLSLSRGSGGSVVSLSTQDRLFWESDSIAVDGFFNGEVDWAVGAIHLLPANDHLLEMWMDYDDIVTLPMRGTPWQRLLNGAEGDLGVPDLSDFNSNHDVLTFAVALVYARTGLDVYREKAARAIMSAIGTEDGTTEVVQIGRNLVCYVLSADLIGLQAYEPVNDGLFRAWIDEIRFVVFPDGSLIDEDEERANNHGRMSGASRAAVALYLQDTADLDRSYQVFRGFLGDRDTYDEFEWRFDLSWQEDEARPVGINPKGAEKNGISIDGALPEEMRRGCGFQDPPCYTNYPWEGLQGALVEAQLLGRAGYEVFEVADRALLRAVVYLDQLQRQFPDEPWWAVGDDSWIPWLVNGVYDTDFPTERARIGKCMGWTDWTHPKRPRRSQLGGLRRR